MHLTHDGVSSFNASIKAGTSESEKAALAKDMYAFRSEALQKLAKIVEKNKGILILDDREMVLTTTLTIKMK